MALIDCPECGREVSNRAPACIYCGCPLTSSVVPSASRPATRTEAEFVESTPASLGPESDGPETESATTLKPWKWGRIANFQSRTRRIELWSATALAIGAWLAGNFINGFMMGPDESWSVGTPGLFTVMGAGVGLWLFFGSTINRLHDIGRKFWWAIGLLIPLANIGIFIWLVVEKGQRTANRWGPPVA